MRNRLCILAIATFAIALASTETASAQFFRHGHYAGSYSPAVSYYPSYWGGYYTYAYPYAWPTYGWYGYPYYGWPYSYSYYGWSYPYYYPVAYYPTYVTPAYTYATTVPAHTAAYPPTQGSDSAIRLKVKLPETDARVWVDDTFVASTGVDRSFASPALIPGTYQYTIRASWSENGTEKGEVRTIAARTGEESVVSFVAGEPSGVTAIPLPAVVPPCRPQRRANLPPRLPPRATESMHWGKVVAIADGKVTMANEDGSGEHTHAIPADAIVTVNGANARLEDLRNGDSISVTTKRDSARTVLRIDAKAAKAN